jgi:hypothetical protein
VKIAPGWLTAKNEHGSFHAWSIATYALHAGVLWVALLAHPAVTRAADPEYTEKFVSDYELVPVIVKFVAGSAPDKTKLQVSGVVEAPANWEIKEVVWIPFISVEVMKDNKLVRKYEKIEGEKKACTIRTPEVKHEGAAVEYNVELEYNPGQFRYVMIFCRGVDDKGKPVSGYMHYPNGSPSKKDGLIVNQLINVPRISKGN